MKEVSLKITLKTMQVIKQSSLEHRPQDEDRNANYDRGLNRLELILRYEPLKQ